MNDKKNMKQSIGGYKVSEQKRVFARLLSKEITSDESKKVSGGEGKMYFTNNEKFKAWDCCK